MPQNGPPPARKRSPSNGEAPPARSQTSGEAPAAKRSQTSGEAPAAKRSPSRVDGLAVRAPSSAANKAVTAAPAVQKAKLVCSAGPSAGSEFVLDGELAVLGRATDNAVSIPDTSVSRKHAQVKRVPGGWAAEDLGSGNGTLVNGERIEGEVRLHNGDTLTMGDTELTFFDAENSTDKRPLPVRRNSLADVPVRRTGVPVRPDMRPRVQRTGLAQAPELQQKKARFKLMAVSVVCLAAVSLAGVKGYQYLAEQKRLRGEAAAAQRKAHVAEIFQDAKNLIRQGRWTDAKARLLEIKSLDATFIAVEDYLKASEREIPNEQALNAAIAALNQNQIANAADAVGKVSPDTQQFQLLGKLKGQLEERVLTRIQDARLLAQQAPKTDNRQDQPKWKEVREITEDIIRAYPDNRDAKVLNDEAKQAIGDLTRPLPQQGPPPAHPWEGAITLFINGDVTGAFSVANACAGKYARCRTLLGQMQDFQNLYKKLEDLDSKGLSQLLSLDQKITEGRMSKMARTAGTRAATIYFKSASSAKVSGQFGRAVEYALKALKADPDHAGAKAILVEMRQKAKDVYLYAYSIRESSPDEAAQKFKEVLQMTPPDDEFHEKAKRWLDQITKQ